MILLHPSRLFRYIEDEYGSIPERLRERLQQLLKPMYKESRIDINCWYEEHNPTVVFFEVVETVGEHVYRFRTMKDNLTKRLKEELDE